MKDVLIDNWSLEEIAFNLNNQQQLLSSTTFSNILEAIVLWDNIYFPNNEHSQFWKYLLYESDFNNYLTELKDNNEFYNSANSLYQKYYKNEYTKNLACGAIRYSLLAENLGYDYFPCDKRALFIQEGKMYNALYKEKNLYINGNFNSAFSRSDFCTTINNEVEEFFKDFNTYYKKDIFEFKLPVLANYIINTKPANLSYFEYSKSLKNKPSVRQFLNYIKEIENSISKSNFIPYIRFKNDVHELVENICKLDKKFIVSIDGTLLPKPIINFDIFKIRKINYIFLKKIINYSIAPKN